MSLATVSHQGRCINNREYRGAARTLLDNQGWFKSWRGVVPVVVNTCFDRICPRHLPGGRCDTEKTRMSPVSAIIWGASRMS